MNTLHILRHFGAFYRNVEPKYSTSNRRAASAVLLNVVVTKLEADLCLLVKHSSLHTPKQKCSKDYPFIVSAMCLREKLRNMLSYLDEE